MNYKKKSNLIKFGQASALLASLSLPTILGGAKADASPTRPRVSTSASTSSTTRPRSLSTGSIKTTPSTPPGRPRSNSLPSGVGSSSKSLYNPEMSIWDGVKYYLPTEGNEDLITSPIRFRANDLRIIVKNNMGGDTDRPEIQKALEKYFGFSE